MLLLAQIPTAVIGLMVAAFFCVCLLLILTVLIQKPAGGGLSGAFGSGAGSGQTAFGAKTGDALTIATIIMFCVFVLGAIGLNYVTRPPSGGGTGTSATSTSPGTTPGTAPGATPPAGSTGKAPATPTGDDNKTPAAPGGADKPAEPEKKNQTPAPAPEGGQPEQPTPQPTPQPAPKPGDEPQNPPAEPPAQPK